MNALKEIVATLFALWILLILPMAAFNAYFLIPMGLILTVVTIMLFPVQRDIKYLSYRPPLFIIGVLTIPYLIFLGYGLQNFTPAEIRAAIFALAIIIVLALGSILPSLKRATGKPIPKPFRPDLIFGEGRDLCCGTMSLGLGIKMLFTPFFLPIWDWWGLFVAITGMILIIPVRGMVRMRMMRARMMEGKWRSWKGIIPKETLLIVGMILIVYGLFNAYMGRTPFTWAPKGNLGGLAMMIIASIFLIFARGGYKLKIDELTETKRQTATKHILYVIGIVPLIYGLAVVLMGEFLTLQGGPEVTWGIPLLMLGFTLIVGVRTMALHNKRLGIIEHMMTFMLPMMTEGRRQNIMKRQLDAFYRMSETMRKKNMSEMMKILNKLPEEKRKILTRTRMTILAEMPSEKREVLMRTMDEIMSYGED